MRIKYFKSSILRRSGRYLYLLILILEWFVFISRMKDQHWGWLELTRFTLWSSLSHLWRCLSTLSNYTCILSLSFPHIIILLIFCKRKKSVFYRLSQLKCLISYAAPGTKVVITDIVDSCNGKWWTKADNRFPSRSQFLQFPSQTRRWDIRSGTKQCY